MPRLLPSAGAVCLGFFLGLMSAPMVFSVAPDWAGGQPQDGSDSASASQAVHGAPTSSAAPAPAAGTSTTPPTPRTPQPSRTASERESPTEQEESASASASADSADERAGVHDRDIPDAAEAELQTIAGQQEAPDQQADRIISVQVEVEQGLPIDGDAFADFAMSTLNDPRSWAHEGAISFARVDQDADMRLALVSPEKVDQMCAPLQTRGRYSCATEGRAAINALRFAQATEEFLSEGTVTEYRHYVINHEIGHLLGHDHEDCSADGDPAPVMQQQTMSLGACRPNGWPHPDAD